MPWKEPADGGVQPGIDTTSPTSPPTGRIAGGTVAEFEALLRTNDRRVRALAHRMVRGDVDDVLQQAYLKAFVEWPTFRG